MSPRESDQSPSQYNNSLLSLLIQRHEGSQGASGNLNFQFNGIIVASPGERTPSSGTKTSRPTEHKVTGTGSKKIGGSVGVAMSRATPMPIFGP